MIFIIHNYTHIKSDEEIIISIQEIKDAMDLFVPVASPFHVYQTYWVAPNQWYEIEPDIFIVGTNIFEQLVDVFKDNADIICCGNILRQCFYFSG